MKQIPQIPVTYAVDILYRNPGASHRSGIAAGADSLEEARKQLNFYVLRVEHIGCTLESVEIATYCAECNGAGQIMTGQRIRRAKTCPVCKGQPKREVLVSWQTWRAALGLQDICTHPQLNPDLSCPHCSFKFAQSNHNGYRTLDEALEADWQKQIEDNRCREFYPLY